MAIKIGKFYITRNNPRELLKEISDKQNIIDKAIGLIYDYQINDRDNPNYKELLYFLKGDSDG